jgi:hypothetical protein
MKSKLIVVFLTATLLSSCAWLKKEEPIIAPIITPIGSCLINALAEGAIEDPIMLVAACGGSTVEMLITIIDDLIASSGQVDSGTPSQLSPYMLRLYRIRARAKMIHLDASSDAALVQ